MRLRASSLISAILLFSGLACGGPNEEGITAETTRQGVLGSPLGSMDDGLVSSLQGNGYCQACDPPFSTLRYGECEPRFTCIRPLGALLDAPGLCRRIGESYEAPCDW